MADRGGSRVHERWAQLRFSVIGQLLASPPAKGGLVRLLRNWPHGNGAIPALAHRSVSASPPLNDGSTVSGTHSMTR